MKPARIDALLRCAVLLGGIILSGGDVLADSGACNFAGTASAAGGTGMGGTGNMAKGTGIGGTGIELGVFISAAQAAGKVTISQGTVAAQNNGRERKLANGDAVCEGDTITTSVSGAVEIRMADGGLLAIRPLSQLKIETFVYTDSNRDRSSMLLLKGSCRIVTGEIGKQYPKNDIFKTASASIAVRAADHEVTVVTEVGAGKEEAGTYDRVSQGRTIISTAKGDVEIHPNQVGFAADIKQYPTLLKTIPAFYSNGSSK